MPDSQVTSYCFKELCTKLRAVSSSYLGVHPVRCDAMIEEDGHDRHAVDLSPAEGSHYLEITVFSNGDVLVDIMNLGQRNKSSHGEEIKWATFGK